MQPVAQAEVKLPFKVWRYTLMRTLIQLSSIATIIVFFLAQSQFPGYFLGSIAYSGLAIFNLVFVCLAHDQKLAFMKNYLFFILFLVATGGLLSWNIIYLAGIASECGAPYYFCAYELTNTLPQLGWGLLSAFVVQEAIFLTYFGIYKKDHDDIKLVNEGNFQNGAYPNQIDGASSYPNQMGYAPVANNLS